ncbi:hypothetical protein [Nioella ostreopsis]|uniref:hypothetical protein n=1 Tax=Nioella ostreopsis TaxID=2448479 RepID=UPI000FDCDD38|nr:hypothetical protein [Nioella ostreopsis]
MPHPNWKRLFGLSVLLLVVALVLGRAGVGLLAWTPVGFAIMALIAMTFPVRERRDPEDNKLNLAGVAVVALYFIGFAGITAGGWWLVLTVIGWFLALALLIGVLQDDSRPGPNDPS